MKFKIMLLSQAGEPRAEKRFIAPIRHWPRFVCICFLNEGFCLLNEIFHFEFSFTNRHEIRALVGSILIYVGWENFDHEKWMGNIPETKVKTLHPWKAALPPYSDEVRCKSNYKHNRSDRAKRVVLHVKRFRTFFASWGFASTCLICPCAIARYCLITALDKNLCRSFWSSLNDSDTKQLCSA